MIVVQKEFLWLSSVFLIVGNVSFGLSFVYFNSFLPILAKHSPIYREIPIVLMSWMKINEHRKKKKQGNKHSNYWTTSSAIMGTSLASLEH